MKLATFVLGIMVVLASVPLTGCAAEKTGAGVVKSVPVGNKVCPVSGEKIDIASGMTPETVEYNGKSYGLCCPGCINKFNAEPEKYTKIAEDEAAASKK
ncbi:MAG: YHS domain-containing protein [Candidatus Omnitrophica bacterium]|nr:YHS domain-containing protein [Candidatus Omnitrophota bacterium]